MSLIFAEIIRIEEKLNRMSAFTAVDAMLRMCEFNDANWEYAAILVIPLLMQAYYLRMYVEDWL